MPTERYRERVEPIQYGSWVQFLNGNPQSSGGTDFVHQTDESMDDWVSRNFRARIAAGEIINNPVLYTSRRTRSTGSGSILTTRLSNGDLYEFYGHATRYALGFAPNSYHQLYGVPVPSASVAALAKFKAIANIDSTPYDFLEDAFEWRETLRFIRNPFKAIRNLGLNFQRDLQKRQRRRSKARLKKSDFYRHRADDIASTWLEYRFAVSPLVRSIESALDLQIQRSNLRRPKRRTARGFSEEVSQDASEELESARNAGWKDYFESTRYTSVTYRAGIIYEVSNPLNDIYFQSGIRFKAIPETIWAVMPYSFMIDRIVDISGMIRGLTNLVDPGVKILAGWVSERQTDSVELRLTRIQATAFSVIAAGETFSDSAFVMKRDPWSPTLSDTDPTINIKGLVEDATKIADLSALIVSAFS